MKRLSAGDRIRYKGSCLRPIVREITEARNTGYTWRYVDAGDKLSPDEFTSENSNDPFFDHQWKLISSARPHA